MRQHGSRLMRAGLGAAGLLTLVACTSSGLDRNFDRSDRYTEVLAGTDLTAPSNLAGLAGTATYTGVGFAEFSAELTPEPGADPADPPPTVAFRGTSDVRLTADFTDGTLSGSMTGWTEESPLEYALDGRVEISNGTIAPDGTFAAQVAGNVERRKKFAEDEELASLIVLIAGDATGAFHDSTEGARASRIVGNVTAPGMTGGFVAGR